MYRKIYSNLAVVIVVAFLLTSHLTAIATAFNDPSSIGENADISQSLTEAPFDFNGPLRDNSKVFDGMFGFSNYRNCIVADEDSVQLVIGVDYSNPRAFDDISNVVASNGGKIVNTVSMKGSIIAVVADIPLDKVPLFREQISKDLMVRYVEPNMKRQALLEPNDPYWINQWGPKKIEANWAWNTTLGSHGIIVAVVDTGIYWRHEDLTSNYWGRGYNWVDNNPYPDDDHGHGTHCAGIIAAVINNNKGIAGLAQVKIMAEKVLNSSGWGTDDWVASGIIHAADNGAKIISMSLGGYGYSSLLHEAAKYAYEKGVLLVAAAGNGNTNVKVYPAAFEEVIAVAATDENDEKAWFSNWGDWIELAAPGVNVYSTFLYNSYILLSGTSMACPHVAGVAALLWSLYPNATNDWIRTQLRASADDLGTPGFDVYFGYGRINARKAIEQKPPEHDLLVLSVQGPQYICPGDTATYHVTVMNFGTVDETDVNVSLIINGNTVDYRYIGFLANGSSAKTTFTWTPLKEGTYNVTLWVKPVAGEVNISNNKVEFSLIVTHPLINPAEGQWASYEIKLYDTRSGSIFYGEDWNLTYERYIDSYRIYITVKARNIYGQVYEGWMIVNTLTRLVEEGVWAGLWYPGWIETDITIGSTVNLINGVATVRGNRILLAGIYPIDCWELTYLEYGYLYLFWYDKATGLWIGMDLNVDYYREELRLKETNIEIGEKYQHELAVTLEAPTRLEPGDTVILNATVYNIGLNDEQNVKISIFVNGTEVASKTLNVLLKDATYTLNYTWTPQIEAFYNITAYVQPLSNELTTLNNVATKIVRVVKIKGYVLFDQTHSTDSILMYDIWVKVLENEGYVVDVLTTTPINKTTFEGYDVFVIPQARDYYTTDELKAIEDFARSGGGLLVIGDDAPYIYTQITSFAGINWDRSGGYYGYTTDITPHPVTEGVRSVYFDSPVSRLLVSFPAQDLIRDRYGNVMLAVTEVGPGAIVCIADENSIDNYYINYADNLRLAVNMISWLANRPPRVYVEYSPLDPYVGEAVTFNASASYDPDGAIVDYLWDFGDGTVKHGTSVVTHVYVRSGTYTVSCTAIDNEGSSKTLKIEVRVQRTTLNVQAKVGAIHFAGEIAEFYLLVSSLGEPVNANLTAQLYFNGSLYTDLTGSIETVGLGFYRIPYTIPWNASAGTYVLVVVVKYYSLSGACLENFLVSQTLTNWSARITEIRDGIATVVIPNLNEVKLNLTAMGVTLQDIFIRVNAINGTTARVETTLGLVNGTVTEIKNNMATIVVPGLGQIQADVSGLVGAQEAWTIPQYLIIVFSLVAAVSAVSSLFLLVKLRKSKA
ncbi:MAG: DUF4350 domain-containing protein [Candidatus Bathyarchaeia archaeon]